MNVWIWTKDDSVLLNSDHVERFRIEGIRIADVVRYEVVAVMVGGLRFTIQGPFMTQDTAKEWIGKELRLDFTK